MPKPRRKVLVPDPRLVEEWKQAATQPIPSDNVTMQWIIKALLYRIRSLSNSQEENYVRTAIRGFTALEKSSLARESEVFQNQQFEWLSDIFYGSPQDSHRLHTLQLQKSLLIDRLGQFERSKRENTALWLKEEEGNILQDLTVFPCYCNYAISLQEILTHPSGKDSKPLCNMTHGMKLAHLILGTLHHLSPTRIETLLKIHLEEDKPRLDPDRLLKVMEEAFSRN